MNNRPNANYHYHFNAPVNVNVNNNCSFYTVSTSTAADGGHSNNTGGTGGDGGTDATNNPPNYRQSSPSAARAPQTRAAPNSPPGIRPSRAGRQPDASATPNIRDNLRSVAPDPPSRDSPVTDAPTTTHSPEPMETETHENDTETHMAGFETNDELSTMNNETATQPPTAEPEPAPASPAPPVVRSVEFPNEDRPIPCYSWKSYPLLPGKAGTENNPELLTFCIELPPPGVPDGFVKPPFKWTEMVKGTLPNTRLSRKDCFGVKL